MEVNKNVDGLLFDEKIHEISYYLEKRGHESFGLHSWGNGSFYLLKK